MYLKYLKLNCIYQIKKNKKKLVLIKIHHTNEIAQSEAAFEVTPWVSFWMHNEFLDFRGQKMSKSLGNICVLHDLIDSGFHPLSYRYFFLQAHYRKQQTFTDEAMTAADRGYRRLRSITAELSRSRTDSYGMAETDFVQRFYTAIHDDLNAPQALALAGEVARNNRLSSPVRYSLIELFDSWLGLDLLSGPLPEAGREIDPRIDALVQEREVARRGKNFEEADRVRDSLLEEGITVEDTSDGPLWRRNK